MSETGATVLFVLLVGALFLGVWVWALIVRTFPDFVRELSDFLVNVGFWVGLTVVFIAVVVGGVFLFQGLHIPAIALWIFVAVYFANVLSRQN